MNLESLNAALLDVLNKAVSAAEKGGEFLAEQIPDVVNQLLMWHMVKNIITVSFILFVVITSFIVLLKLFPKNREYLKVCKEWYDAYGKDEKRNEMRQSELSPYALIFWVSVWTWIVSTLYFFISGIDYILRTVQIIIAPKVYLIEYAASLVK